MNYMKKIIKKIIYGHNANSDTCINYLKKIGMDIGDRVIIYDPGSTLIDTTRPWMISIGNDVKITKGVTILTHGYDWSVLAGVHDEVLGSAGKVKIGNNVFIGMNTTILKGVSIGNNVIIGAASLVNKDIPDDCVVAGNPARVIMSLPEYYEKRKKAQLSEASEVFSSYYQRFGEIPPEEVFDEFFFLFHKRSENLCDKFKWQMSHHGKYEATLEKMVSCKPIFNGYDEFVDYELKQLTKGEAR